MASKNKAANEKEDDKKKRAEAYTEEEVNQPKKKKVKNSSSLANQLWVLLLCIVALFITVSYIIIPASGGESPLVGKVGKFVFESSFGLFGGAAILIPILIFIHALFHKRDYESGAIAYKWSFSVLEVLFISALVASLTPYDGGNRYELGQKLIGGGVIGGGLASFLAKGIGNVGVAILSIAVMAVFGMFVLGKTPAAVWERLKFYLLRRMENREHNKTHPKAPKTDKKQARESREETREKYPKAANTSKQSVKRARRGDIDPDVFYGTGDIFDDTSEMDVMDVIPAEEIRTVPRTDIIPSVGNTAAEETDEFDLDKIFTEPENEAVKQKFSQRDDDADEYDIPLEAQKEIKVERKRIGAQTQPKQEAIIVEPKKKIIPDPPKPPAAPSYLFPPIDLLPLGKKTGDNGAENEISINAQKLVETLANFNIHVRVVNVSRGPAVTRYEIAPEPGTKVSAISNRVEDISLGLASAGVIVEGVIPGKSAIGIEVPNRNVSIVYLRELIDTDEFRTAKSRINAALGIDLTGTKVFLDIAKMPHLLIAGATGMGKSVCMNSLIVSLLYKATPDEVKFIFIDPKKVELNIYNGLPHLIVPVVFDPKKAAGALHWCVVEMERRYDILEQMGKRNLAQYNEATKDDPTAEKLPQIVIVIDELADLMTTAPDDVETSIARIAAKARAAGMHLIIGTQRPDVSVITGTIKSNIPSRIAFTVSSQIDSRTILDGAGAEKLVGRGDMLFSPVGSRLPLRVQGAFVDEKEIEDIVSFIKEHCGACEYDADIAAKIDKEAELCGKKGKGGGGATQMTFDGDGDDEPADDPMLKSAIEIAIDEKKISTSLIQRRLSLGYGRAAKLIDVMERRGIVSAPDGQKPRSVLITREQYYEMQMRETDGETSEGE
ncbi:MAG: DNA translocase FtsK [Clostridia bacterium]|nr:DNA translocase FtsK [Clostridia bacterium]